MRGAKNRPAKIAISRLPQRYRELVRKEVSGLVGDAALIDDEIEYLVRLVEAREVGLPGGEGNRP
jgi:hypothetical protein